jgi:hypothetical protein
MIDILPYGTGIGEMEASSQWIFSHTTRFMGVVIVTIHESRGFILINKGNPLKCYFKHGKRTLWGHTAYEYFKSQPFIQFELRRYNESEMSEALNLVTIEESRASDRASEDGLQDVVEPVGIPPGLSSSDELSADSGTASGLSSDMTDYEKTPDLTLYEEPVSGTFVAENLPEEGQRRVISDPGIHFHVYSGEPGMSGAGELLLGQIINLPGVIAVSIFNRRMNILSIGDINLEYLVDVAEDLIESVKGIIPILKTGPFIQMTLQIPAGNLIIAPYWDEYLCILTNQEINLGQIRKILRDIPAGPPHQNHTG